MMSVVSNLIARLVAKLAARLDNAELPCIDAIAEDAAAAGLYDERNTSIWYLPPPV